MRATRLTHVSIHAYDLEESMRFYVDVLGMRRVPSPDFAQQVEWLQLGDQQLHLFLSEDPAPHYHHIGLDVDDFEAAYRVASERGLFDGDAFGAEVRELMDGTVQMYLRDPAGNLVEVDWPDASTLDPAILAEMVPLESMAHQEGDAAVATLYHPAV